MRHALALLAPLAGALVMVLAISTRASAQPNLPPPPPPPMDTTSPPPAPPPTGAPQPTQLPPGRAPAPTPTPKPRARAGGAPAGSIAPPPSDTDAPSDSDSSTSGFLTTKTRLEPRELALKREGGYFTGLPLLNYDSNTGVGIGARAYYFWDGSRADPVFAYTPYLHRAFAQAFATTTGRQYHLLDYDGVYVGRSPFRVRAGLVFERDTNAYYFGRGASTLAPLSFPGSADSYARLSEYEDATSRVQGDGTTYARYNRYILTRPLARASLERDLFGGAVRVLGGASLSYVTIRDYTGVDVAATDASGASTRAPEALTKLRGDCNAGRVVGCTDQWNNVVRVAIAYDTRDYEPDPTSGIFADLTAEFSGAVIGSKHDYGRVTAAPRFFFSPMPKLARLVIAVRGVYSVEFGDVPFFDMSNFAFTDGDQTGLGGLRTIRGYRQDRFVGKIAAFTNVEIRWTFADVTTHGQRLQFMVVPFLDMGRVFDDVRDTTLAGWKRGQGGALRMGWNQATIFSVDYGVSSEGSGLYVNFGHQF